MKNRIIAICLVFSLLIPCLSFSVSAGFGSDGAYAYGVGYDSGLDTSSALMWRDFMDNTGYMELLIDVSEFYFTHNITGVSVNGFDGLFNYAVQKHLGECSDEELYRFCEFLNYSFSGSFADSAQYYQLISISPSFVERLEHQFASAIRLNIWELLFGEFFTSPIFEIHFDNTRNVYRIKEMQTGYWVTDTYGRFACVPVSVSSGGSAPVDNLSYSYRPWADITDDLAAGAISYHMLNTDALSSLASDFSGTVTPRGEYKMIRSGNSQGALCDQKGCPFATWYTADSGGSGDAALGTPQTDVDTGDINILNEHFVNINGQLALITELLYDEVNKTYTLEANTYNVTNNNYNYYTYNWTYHINYTSVTYIGETEEYDAYEFYYKLPDGRSSADLTREELEQLNLSVDVINYGRSTDDTRLRALYHFDGTTEDSSFWNYTTSFDWASGASITYLDAGTFGGCLYLDELDHDFTVSLPSALGTADFTVDFRFYQSATLAPDVDSTLSIGNQTVLQFDGAHFIFDGNQINTPVGSWNHLAFVRENGVLHFYLNGVEVGSTAFTPVLSRDIRFSFGNEQQTYKYIDELRVLNFAVWDDDFSVPSLPYDTNLSLVLPDSAIPVADEYWNVSMTGTNLLAESGLDWWDGLHPNSGFSSSSFHTVSDFNSVTHSAVSSSFPITYRNIFSKYPTTIIDDARNLVDTQYIFPNCYLLNGITNYSVDDYSSMSRGSVTSIGGYSVDFTRDYVQTTKNSGLEKYAPIMPIGGLFWQLSSWHRYTFSGNDPVTGNNGLASGNYVFTVVFSDGSKLVLPFDNVFNNAASNNKTASLNGYTANFYVAAPASAVSNGSVRITTLQLLPDNPTADILYMALEEGTTSSVSAEFVASVSGIDSSTFNTPTLAVRSDIEVTDYQIGGVRPSIPSGRGQVYAMVQSGFITSLQIFDGRAWIECDGRIWTGSRWIPYSSYNVVTLSDLYDVADASGQSGYEYIYTDVGFWAWFQKQWLDFKNWYSSLDFSSIGGGSGTSGGGGSSSNVVVKVENDPAFVPFPVNPSGGYDFQTGNNDDISLGDAVKYGAKGGFSIIKSLFGFVGSAFSNLGAASEDLNEAYGSDSSSFEIYTSIRDGMFEEGAQGYVG